MRVLAVVPARGGSKAIPRKNLFPLRGRPLLAYTVDAIKRSHAITRAVLSSDDPEIIAVGQRLGLEAPFVRPHELSGDRVPSGMVARHALETLERSQSERFDAVVLLEPTSPLRRADDIDAAVELLASSGADAVATICRVDAPHPAKMQLLVDGQLHPLMPNLWREGLTRQELPAVYFLTGAVYAVQAAVLRETGSLWGRRTDGLEMPAERSVNVDSMLDMALAEVLLAQCP